MDFKEKQIGSEEQRIVLRTLAESIATPGCRLLEIGSWCGESSVALGKIAKQNGGHLFCVDWWKGSEGTYQEEIARKGDVFAFFWDQIRREGLEDVVIPIRGKSDVSSKIFKENIFDMIFIDGDHRYENVLRDIQQHAALVKDKGILCGHDCEGRISDYDMSFLQSGKDVDDYESVHCGVVLAVGSTFKQYSLNYSIWSVRANGKNGSWEPTSLVLPGLKDKKQLPPPQIGISKNYGIFRFGKLVYAIPRSLDDIDVTEEEVNKHPEVVNANTLSEVEVLVGEKMSFTGTPILLQPYKGYNILQIKDRIFALDQSLGDLDIMFLEEPQLKEYEELGKYIIGSEIDEIKGLVDQLRWKELYKLIEDYKGFNVVLYNGKYFALSQRLGEIDITRENEENLKKYRENYDCAIGSSLHEVKLLVDQLLYKSLERDVGEREKKIATLEGLIGIKKSFTSHPILLDLYKGYNLFQLKDSIYAIAQSLGKLDLLSIKESELKEYQKCGKYFIGKSLHEVKLLVEQLLYKSLERDVGEREKKIVTLNEDILEKQKRIDVLENEIADIKSTRWFRFFDRLNRTRVDCVNAFSKRWLNGINR